MDNGYIDLNILLKGRLLQYYNSHIPSNELNTKIVVCSLAFNMKLLMECPSPFIHALKIEMLIPGCYPEKSRHDVIMSSSWYKSFYNIA